jgi:hypothetical protein
MASRPIKSEGAQEAVLFGSKNYQMPDFFKLKGRVELQRI